MHGDVRRAIRLLLLTRQCSRAEVARRLGLHERALGRRLQATGTTFQRLLDETREEIARQLLCDTDIPVARVAAALGYGDADGVHPRLYALDRPHSQRVSRTAVALTRGHRLTRFIDRMSR